MSHPQRILVLGASYGLLPGVKLALGGHAVTFVARPEEAATMRAEGRVGLELPLRRLGQQMLLEMPVEERAAAGYAAVLVPEEIDPGEYDFVILAMQEPHFAAPEIAALMRRIGKAELPCLSLMNLPPPPFMRRLGDFPREAFEGVYSSDAAWDELDPALVSLASPDAQALRRDPARPGRLTVTLPSNLKAAPFADPAAQRRLEALADDMARLKLDWQGREVRPPVHLLAMGSLFAPLAKWPMLIAGNCRCLVPGGGTRSIAAAVHDDLKQSREVYEQVALLARKIGARDRDLVSFESYAQAAKGLTAPSSAARALAAGAVQVERIDLLVLNLMRLNGLDPQEVQAIANEIETRLRSNAPAEA